MKRLFKWLSVFVGLIVLGLTAAIVIVTSVIQPNQFKPIIISQFKQLTGFEIQIPGNLSWSFYPHLGMEAEEVIINETAVFSAHLKKLVLRVKFAPLLHQQLDFSKVSISTLQINNLQASHVEAKVSLKNQVLAFRKIRADLYQGVLNAEATVHLKAPLPQLHVIGKLEKVAVADFIKGLSGKSAKLQVDGLGDLQWDVTTEGKETNELLNHLNGRGSLAMARGSLKGIDLAYFVNTAAALINKEPLPKGSSEGETAFGQLRGTAVIQGGVMTTNDLMLDSSFYTVTATGLMDLVNKTLDYHLDVKSKVEEKTNKVLALYGKTVPIRVSGSLSDPAVTLDTLALMKEIGREQLEKVGEEIQKRLPDKANAFIKSLFH